tara:strand:+ start:426 stop:1061 length:636 start_codon:yes stop_codon:yes gene_type:complete
MPVNLNNLNLIKKNIADFPEAKLMAVTKNRTINDIQELLAYGINVFGENRVQEAKKKYSLIDKPLHHFELHMIGPLQSNKVKEALSIFDVIQSVDRENLVQEISKYIKLPNINTKRFFIQVNIGNESQKSGIAINNIKSFYNFTIEKGLEVEGLMCIPPLSLKPDDFFEKMILLKEEINPNLKLSMGMSNDYHVALSMKSNLIRVGSFLFD